MNAAATAKPSGGEMTSHVTTLATAPQLTPPNPPSAAIAAPTRPPMNACVELLGRPKYQVMRFHAIPPTSPARMIVTVGSFSSDAMVLDTALPNTTTVTSAPTRLRVAASPTASRALIARVDTAVAIALAVSWNPFVKSKASATRMVATSRRSAEDGRVSRRSASRVLDRDRDEQVRDVLALVHRLLEQVVEVLPLHQVGGAHAVVGEQPAQRLARDPVSLVLEAVDLLA